MDMLTEGVRSIGAAGTCIAVPTVGLTVAAYRDGFRLDDRSRVLKTLIGLSSQRIYKPQEKTGGLQSAVALGTRAGAIRKPVAAQ
jgi:hypothetical protein